MKKLSFYVAMLSSALAFSQNVSEVIDAQVADQIYNIVNEDMKPAFENISIKSGETITILPLVGDTEMGFVGGLVKNAATKAGLTVVEAKDSPMFDSIMQELAWNERKADLLDGETLAKLGGLKATENYLYGKVLSSIKNDRYVFVDIELHITSVATKQHIWGDTFTRRAFFPGSNAPQGWSDIPVDIRKVIKEDISQQVMDSISKAPNAKTVKTIVIVPFSGDEDLYVTHCAQDALTKKGYLPKDLGVKTLGEAVYLLSENSNRADSVLSGVVRELSLEQEPETEYSTNHVFHAVAEIQVKLEKSNTREILWSDTIQVQKTFEKELTQTEKLEAEANALNFMIRYGLYGLGGLVGLMILLKLFGAMTRTR